MSAGAPEDPLAELRRWEESGAVWRVVGRSRGAVTLALLTCDGGEEMSRFSTSEPAVLDHVGDRAGSDDG